MTSAASVTKGALRRECLRDAAALAPEKRAMDEEAIYARVMLMPEVRDARGILVCISFAVTAPASFAPAEAHAAGARARNVRTAARTVPNNTERDAPDLNLPCTDSAPL